MDKKAILAVVLSLVIWVVWQKAYLEPIQQQAALHAQALKEKEEQQAAAKEQVKKAEGAKDGTSSASAKVSGKALPPVEIRQLVIENGEASMAVSNAPWAVSSWGLKSFSRTLEKREEKVDLVEATGFSHQLRVRFSDAALSSFVEQPWRSVEKTGERSVTVRTEAPGFQASRVITLNGDGFGGTLEYRFRFAGEAPKFIFLDLHGSPNRPNDKEGSIFGEAPDKVRVSYRDLNGHHYEIGASLTENRESAASVKWLGLDTRYFLLAMVPGGVAGDDVGAQVARDQIEAPSVRGSLVFPTAGKQEVSFSAKIYFGPKDMELLSRVDPQLVDAIDFGWTSAIAIPLLQALKWLYSYVSNYGIAIIILTFVIKMMLFPLTYKSMVSMAKMAKLQPQLNALREKYKDDREKLNMEMMNFMKQNGYNPVGGCLPILLQMPIFFALYRVLFNSMELYQAPFGGWIHDLSSPDPFFVTPLLLTGLMYFQQKISPTTAADPTQQKMLQIMPVMFGAFMIMLPSGLTVYMVVNSAVSIAQQYFLNRKLGITPGGMAAAKA